MSDRTLVNVQMSFVEYRASFREPIFEAWRKNTVVPEVFRALREWNVTLENVSAKQNPLNLGELQVTFNVLNWKIFFNLGLGALWVTAANPSWDEVNFIVKVIQVGLDAVRSSANAQVENQMVTLSMHLMPQGKSIRDVTAQFLRIDSDTLMKDVIGNGFSVYKDDSAWVVDKSGLYPESLFLKINRNFEADKPLKDITSALEKDENDLMELLQLRFS